VGFAGVGMVAFFGVGIGIGFSAVFAATAGCCGWG
jgi:hypothetical protein